MIKIFYDVLNESGEIICSKVPKIIADEIIEEFYIINPNEKFFISENETEN